MELISKCMKWHFRQYGMHSFMDDYSLFDIDNYRLIYITDVPLLDNASQEEGDEESGDDQVKEAEEVKENWANRKQLNLKQIKQL